VAAGYGLPSMFRELIWVFGEPQGAVEGFWKASRWNSRIMMLDIVLKIRHVAFWRAKRRM